MVANGYGVRVRGPVTSRLISGVYSGLLASFLLGWAPILGKLAYRSQVGPMTLAALRTLVAAALLWCAYLVAWRDRIAVTWRALANCLIVGAVNGVGSLFYYNGLVRLDASRAALLGAMYPVWVVVFLSASGQTVRAITLLQLAGSMVGAVLVTSPWVSASPADLFGATLMIASAAVNGWYIVMGQWVLADVPSRSGALYILTGMAITVSVACFVAGDIAIGGIPMAGWQAILALGLTTALSRVAVFLSLERLGGMQTAILGLVELAVSLALAFIFLGDRLGWYQWLGGALLLGGGLMARLTAEHDADVETAFDPVLAESNR